MKNLNKFLVLFLSFILVFTTLNFTPFTGEALASEVEGSLEQEPPIEEKVYPTFKSFFISSYKEDTISVSTNLSEDLSTGQNILYIYKVGESNPIKTIDNGKDIVMELPRPTEGIVQYYGSIGSSVSSEVEVTGLKNNSWELTASVDRNNFKTNDPQLPIISWNTPKSIVTKLIYITDESGRILHKRSNESSGSWEIDPFYTQTKKFKVYLGSRSTYHRTHIKDINVQALAEEILIIRDPYLVEAEIDTNYTTDSSYINVKWSSNQNIPSGISSSVMSLHLVDETTKKIVASKSNSVDSFGVISFKPIYDGKGHQYRLYLAVKPSGAKTLDELKDIEYSSNLINTKSTDWNIKLSVDKPIFYTDDDSPRFIIKSNQDAQKAGYSYHLVDVEKDQIIYSSAKESSLQPWGYRFYTGGPKLFKVIVAPTNCGGACNHPVSELKEIISESNIVSITRAPWTISLSGPQYYSTKSSSYFIYWNTNQIIRQSKITSKDGTNGNYRIYVCNLDNRNCNSILPGQGSNFGAITGKHDKEYKTLKYKTYVAKTTTTPQTIESLEDIQAESNTLKIRPLPWGIKSKNISEVHNEKAQTKLVTIEFETNHSLTASTAYAAYAFNKETGNKLSGPIYNYPYKFNFTTSSFANSEYILYVADRNSNVKTVSDLTNIQASSDDEYPNFFTSSTSNNQPNRESMTGGGDPSSEDCKQQCHGDPINSFTGELFESNDDALIEGSFPTTFKRSFSTTEKDRLGSLGYGFRHNFEMSIKGNKNNFEDSRYITVTQENGSQIVFLKVETEEGIKYIPSNGTQTKLNETEDIFIFERKDKTKFYFDKNSKKLIKIKDKLDNEITLKYTEGKLSEVSNSEDKILINWSGNLISKISSTGYTTEYFYTDSRLTSVKSNLYKNLKKYEYDSENRITTIQQINGGRYSNTYDSENRVIKQVNPNGGETLFSYENLNRVITLPDGSKSLETYNNQGLLTKKVIDYQGTDEAAYTYTYDSSNRLIQEINPMGHKTEYRYDSEGNIFYVKAPNNTINRFVYDKDNNLVEHINSMSQSTKNVYDERGVLQKTIYPNGYERNYETDASGRTTSFYEEDPNKKNLYSYDETGLVENASDTLGNTSQFKFNEDNDLKEIISPLGNKTEYEYTNKLLKKITMPNGSTESYVYDDSSRVIKETESDGSITEYSYDLMDNVTTIKNKYGLTSFEYDLNNRLIKQTDYKGVETTYVYNGLGMVKEIYVDDELQKTLKYTKHGLLQSETDSKGAVTSYSFDTVGNLLKITDADGKSRSFTYNSLNQMTQERTHLGKFINYSYDQFGNLTQTSESSLRKRNYEYDLKGNLIKTTYNDGSFETREYDSENQLVSLTDRTNKTTSYVYDAEGNISKEIRPDSSEINYSYDSMSNLIEADYDDFSIVYSYDLSGKLISSKKTNEEAIEYSYSARGEVTSRGPPSQKVNYTYNNFGELSSIEYPNGDSINYEFSKLGTLEKVSANGSDIAAYSYDSNFNLTSATLGNGVIENNSYDALNRLKEINVSKDDESFYKRNLNYDADSFITSVETLQGENKTESKSYVYDNLGVIKTTKDVLTNVTTPSTYDFLNNLKTSGKSSFNYSSELNQLESSVIDAKNTNYSYDSLGNRTSKSTIDGIVEYEWTADNKLSKVSSDVSSFDFKYDNAGLLTSKTTTSDDLTKSEEYVWDAVSSDIPMLLEDSDKTYIYGAKNSPIAQIDKETSEITYLHGDERNSVILATDSTGDKLWDRKFNEYGVLLEGENLSKDSSNFGYAGEYYDSDIELYNLRARWYEPETASFISVDPLSLVTGENYSYASGNPLSFTDPLGLFSMGDLGASAAGIIDGLIGVPAVSTIANAVSPGSIDNCSAFYAGVAGVAGVASFFIPGGGALKGAVAAGKGISKVSKTLLTSTTKTYGGKQAYLEDITNVGGSYSEISSLQKGFGKFVNADHVPHKGWVNYPLSKESGGAIGLTLEDHKKTISYAGRARSLNKETSNMSFSEITQHTIDSYRSLFGNKYEKGIEELLTYYRNNPNVKDIVKLEGWVK